MALGCSTLLPHAAVALSSHYDWHSQQSSGGQSSNYDTGCRISTPRIVATTYVVLSRCSTRPSSCSTSPLPSHAAHKQQTSPALVLVHVMAWLPRTHLLRLLLLLTAFAAGNADTLPAALVLLPLSSFAQASLIAPFNCNPIYGSSPCNGHGDCYLLLDSSAPLSHSFLNTSYAPPIPAYETSLDTETLNADTPLPVAVCLCHSGWTGRGDYINHYAMDGDSCGISRTAITALSSLSIIEFTVILLLALHRLYHWYLWHAASVTDSGNPAPALAAEAESQHSSAEEENNIHNSNNESNQSVHPHSSPITHHRSVSRAADGALLVNAPPRAMSPSPPLDILASPTRAPRAIQRIQVRAAGGQDGAVVIKSKGRKQHLLYRHMTHITFLHPLLSAAMATILIAYFGIRVGTDSTLGNSWTMSVLSYVYNIPFLWACSVAVLNTLRAASAITRTQTGAKGLSTVNQWARRCLIGLGAYSSIVGLLVFLVRSDNSQQQLMAILSLCLCFTPISILCLVSVVATNCITRALVQHLDQLSPQQQLDRLVVYGKLRHQSHLLGWDIVSECVLGNPTGCTAAAPPAGCAVLRHSHPHLQCRYYYHPSAAVASEGSGHETICCTRSRRTRTAPHSSTGC